MSDITVQTLTSEVTIFPSQSDLPDDEKNLCIEARAAMKYSYSPYSNFRVGAAVLLEDGTIVQGSNQENAAYGPTNCAERSAMFTIGSMGKQDQIRKIAVIARPASDMNTPVPLEKEVSGSPCGICRQVMKEYESLSGQKWVILIIQNSDRVFRIEGVDILLPFAFGPNSL
ncbi:MAG: cytidine deaminase [Candidatus Roizmanbacteria bacterium]|nr:cytidine deaminase [Candidatus Roizmanbacteria bacterium]